MSFRRDCVVYSSHCLKLEGRKVAVKVYEKSSLSPSKLRAVKREAAMMIYMTRKRWPSLRHRIMHFLGNVPCKACLLCERVMFTSKHSD